MRLKLQAAQPIRTEKQHILAVLAISKGWTKKMNYTIDQLTAYPTIIHKICVVVRATDYTETLIEIKQGFTLQKEKCGKTERTSSIASAGTSTFTSISSIFCINNNAF